MGKHQNYISFNRAVLFELIRKTPLNIRKICEESGVEEAGFYRILSGKSKNPTFCTVVKIADYFRVSPEVFIKRSPWADLLEE